MKGVNVDNSQKPSIHFTFYREREQRILLGEEKYASYYHASEDKKTDVLTELLQARLDDRRAEMAPKAQAAAENSRGEVGVSIDGKKYREREVYGGNAALTDDKSTSWLDDEIPF